MQHRLGRLRRREGRITAVHKHVYLASEVHGCGPRPAGTELRARLMQDGRGFHGMKARKRSAELWAFKAGGAAGRWDK